MKWTKKYPEGIGWYWLKRNNIPRIVEVNRALPEQYLFVRGHWCEGDYEDKNWEWAGPIPEPDKFR